MGGNVKSDSKLIMLLIYGLLFILIVTALFTT